MNTPVLPARSAADTARTTKRAVVATIPRERAPLRSQFSPVHRAAARTVATLGLVLISAGASAAPAGPGGSPAAIERGRYLVENVGMCADCHTTRTEKGEFDRSRWLLGAPLPFQPTVPMPWTPAAPPIAGLPTMTEAQGSTFLQTGKRPDGSMPRPPMPEFRFNPEDANAVAAYLKSLAK